MAKRKKLTIVILAAGLGTRMKSSQPKVLHKICEKPILWWILWSVAAIKPQQILLVLGHAKDLVADQLKFWRNDFPSLIDNLKVVEQKQQLGSGDALKSAAKFFSDDSDVLVISGDVPLISPETLKNFCIAHRKSASCASVLSANLENPSGYGRIVRDSRNNFCRIVEERDATTEEREIREVNSGIYLFSGRQIKEALKKIKPVNVKKEYYLTDAIEILYSEGKNVAAINIAPADEILGINNRLELAIAEKKLRMKINEKHALNGVTFVDIQSAYIGPDVKIKNDTTIYPNVIIRGRTVIGKNCVIGSGCYISDAEIGDNVKIRASYIYESKIESDVFIGPFTHIRPGTIIKRKARIGNFTEIKKSHIGADTKVSHLAYIGDSYLEENINVGAGAITCNYDGKNKHRTHIGKNSFIGSNVNLVAPVTVGRNVLIGAGSTITKNVPDNTLAIERAKQTNLPRKK